MPEPGQREVVIDSNGGPVAVIECTAVRTCRLADVDLQHEWWPRRFRLVEVL